jgi:hypothetical protein
MNEELSVGVRIFLERCKTNPEEIMDVKWLNVVEAVFHYKETRARSASLRGLTEQEIDLIYEALNELYRAKFDSYIMANVLNADEGERGVDAYRISLGKTGGGGIIKPGAIYEAPKAQTSITAVTSSTSISKILNKLNP